MSTTHYVLQWRSYSNDRLFQVKHPATADNVVAALTPMSKRIVSGYMMPEESLGVGAVIQFLGLGWFKLVTLGETMVFSQVINMKGYATVPKET